MAHYYYVSMGNDNIFKINTIFGNFSGNFGKTIKVGDWDLQTAAEVGTNFLATTGQAIADSVESKKDKAKKADNQWKRIGLYFLGQ